MADHKKPRVDEDEDLDDLDDVLDQFKVPTPGPAVPISPPSQPTSASASTSSHPVADTSEALPEGFTSEFAKEMESLISGLMIEPRGDPQSETAEQKQLAAAWEAMLVEDMDAMLDPSKAHTPADSSSPGPKDADFQSRIRSTMNKLKESESGLKTPDPSASGVGESFESLLSQLEGLGGDGTEGDEQLQGVLEEMMGQLMSKDVLYEPLKELYDKFPEYLANNSSTISPEDKTRFEAQISCIKQLLAEFDAKTYQDEDKQAREKIVNLMGELQSHGSPPEEIMGPLPPGFSMGSDGLPNIPDGCNVT